MESQTQHETLTIAIFWYKKYSNIHYVHFCLIGTLIEEHNDYQPTSSSTITFSCMNENDQFWKNSGIQLTPKEWLKYWWQLTGLTFWEKFINLEKLTPELTEAN